VACSLGWAVSWTRRHAAYTVSISLRAWELPRACSLGWAQVVALLESYVLDHEVRETLDGLREE
jgi:hypothetical protein